MNRLAKTNWLMVSLALVLLLAVFPSARINAQGQTRTFPETGKTVRATFLTYWNTHGGLAQQGLPISEEMQEKSDTDGKTYTVQYFERAVFEQHPEFAGTPNEVLLSLLGTFRYKLKYPAGAPGQVPNSQTNSHLFAETGKHAGGIFLAYWTSHGALAQQGYPISEEFNEVSDLNGQTYRVQYFERAVFEQHPEFAGTPNEVLLSQLGTFRYRDKYTQPKPSPTLVVIDPTPTRPPQPPAATPTTGADPNSDCSGIPASVNQTVRPTCGPRGTTFEFEAGGFTPGEPVGIYATEPSQAVFGAPFQEIADDQGKVTGVSLSSDSSFPLGIWADTMEGTHSHVKSIGYFKIIAPSGGNNRDCSGIPASVNMTVTPNCGPGGTRFAIQGTGFQPGESVGRYYTSPTGDVIPGSSQSIANSAGEVSGITFITSGGTEPGIWAGTFEGVSTHRKAIAYFKVTAP